MKANKRIGLGQKWGTIGVKRKTTIGAAVSHEKAKLAQYRAKGLGLTVSAYLNLLLSNDIGPGYDRA
jgi:hypothetical protein